MKHLHYGSDEWLAYKSRTTRPEIMDEMETHLQVCESCQELYLALIDQPDLDLAQQFIPLDFTELIIDRLEILLPSPKIINFPVKKQAINQKGIFAYYVTAAVLTLALMGGGVFDSMVDQSMHFTRLCMVQSHSIETQVGRDWSAQLCKNGSRWMHNRSFEKERNVKNAK